MSRVRDLASILTASSNIATDAEITSSISSHAAASDPHGDRAYAASLIPSQTGNTGKYLTTNGTAVSWGTISAGSYTLLSTNAIPSATTTLTVSSIPSGYKHLFINLTGFNPSTSTQASLRFYTGNGQYTYSSIECSSASVFNSGYLGAGSVVLTPGDFLFFSSTGGADNNASIMIYDYTSNKNKNGFWNIIGYANAGDRSAMGQFGINSTAAISSISFNWSSGAQFLTGTGREVKIFGVN